MLSRDGPVFCVTCMRRLRRKSAAENNAIVLTMMLQMGNAMIFPFDDASAAGEPHDTGSCGGLFANVGQMSSERCYFIDSLRQSQPAG